MLLESLKKKVYVSSFVYNQKTFCGNCLTEYLFVYYEQNRIEWVGVCRGCMCVCMYVWVYVCVCVELCIYVLVKTFVPCSSGGGNSMM